jgi:glycosyltransferase involved in cell wall biosynthesis
MHFAGDQGMQSTCDAAGLKNIRCLGLLPWPEMQEQLQGAWCSVLPTRGDTSPNSVKEARVIGLPVVTTKHGGQAGYIMDGVNGRIVEPLTSENLAAALSDVMSSHDRAKSLGHGRHQQDREYLDPRRTADGFAEIYQDLKNRKLKADS